MRNRLVAVIFVALLASASFCCAQAGTGKVEPLGPISDSSVPDAVQKVLDTKGYRAVLDDGSVACELWLRQGVPAGKNPNGDAVLYPLLTESTLVGVISFPKPSTDYRGQPIKAGAYTLRYENIPNDGDHLGVAPNPDFLLLIPAASDSDPNASYKFNDLVDMSRHATGTRHPGPMSMVQAKGSAPSFAKDDEDHWVLSVALKMGSGADLPIGLIVKGTAPQ